MYKYFDIATLFFLCVLIFFLPISKAAIQITVSLTILAFFGTLLTKKFKNFPKTKLNIPLLTFFIFLCLSTAFSIDFKASLITLLKKNLEWFLLFFITIATLRTKKRIKIFLGVLFFSAFCIALDGLFQQIQGADLFRGHIYENRMTASFNHYNDFAGYLGVLFPITISLSLIGRNLEKNKKEKFFIFLSILLFYCLVATLSRGGFLSTFIALDFLLFFSFLKLKGLNYKKIAIKLLIFINALILFSIIGFSKLPPELIVERMHIMSGAGRWNGGIWTQAISLFKSRPLLGYGPGNFMSEISKFNSSLTPTYAHNCYLQMLTEIGIFGLISFLFVIIVFFKEVINSIIKNNDFLLSGILSGILAYLIHAGVDTHFYSMKLSDFFWLMLGLAIAVKRQDPIDYK